MPTTKEVIASLLESPDYLELPLKERYALVKRLDTFLESSALPQAA